METKQKKRGIGALNRIVENDFIHRVSADEYREKIKDVYGGKQGALLATASHLSMHIQLGRRLFRTRKFDLRGMKSILDVGSGAGQIAGHLLGFLRSGDSNHLHRSFAADAAAGAAAAEERAAGLCRGRCHLPALCR